MTSTAPQTPDEDPAAKRLRGFGPVGLVAIAIILVGNFFFVPLTAILVLVWRKLSGTSWREIGYIRPKSWIAAVMIGIIFGIALKFAMKAVVMPLFGAPPLNQAFQFLVGNRNALPGMLYLVTVGAGFGEETFFRGYLFERFGKVFGTAVFAKVATVLITTAWFGAVHYVSQGLPGVQNATVVGLIFGSIFTITGRIWMLIFAHAAFDLTAVALIYWNLESRVAHLFFK